MCPVQTGLGLIHILHISDSGNVAVRFSNAYGPRGQLRACALRTKEVRMRMRITTFYVLMRILVSEIRIHGQNLQIWS